MSCDNWILLTVILIITAPIFWITGIVNLCITIEFPSCSSETLSLHMVEFATGIVQIVFGFLGGVLFIYLCLDKPTASLLRQQRIISIVYLMLAHTGNVAMAIIDIISFIQYSLNCNYFILAMSFSSIIIAFSLPFVLAIVTGIWFIFPIMINKYKEYSHKKEVNGN